MVAGVGVKYEALAGGMDERVRRRWAACEAMAMGRGGVAAVARATGISPTTIRKGVAEVRAGTPALAAEAASQRVRRPGGGRRPLTAADPRLEADLRRLVEPATRGDPGRALLWTSKSTRKLAAELARLGHRVSHMSVARMLGDIGYSLQANRKTREGQQHADRDAQFEHINRTVRSFQRRGQPVISVDAKKRELVGDFKNSGREWRPRGSPEPVRVHDFRDPDLGVAIPYGVYDLTLNRGWVSVGIDHDTAEFAAATIRRWWARMGRGVYPEARALLITADAGGSNGPRTRLWKLCLQGLADELGLRISVCHFPPGTSKWNKIEHRMFCHVTENWRGRPLVSHAVIVDLIGHTSTREGLKVSARLDASRYKQGIKVSDEALRTVRIKPDRFHGEWNYSILPK